MKSEIKKMSEAAILLAIGILLPMAFHLWGAAGAIFAPMHLPVLLAGFILGPFYGALLGLLTPLFSFLFTGMPGVGLLPGMMMELFIYGAMSGLLFRLIKTKNLYLDIYLSLILAMLLGRIAGGLTTWVIYASQSKGYSLLLWATAYFVTPWPGILIQIFAVPAIMIALIKSHLFSENERYLNPRQIEEATRKSQADFFDHLAPHWEENRHFDRKKVDHLLTLCQLQEGERVLDVACGDGILDETLLSYGAKVEAIDISPTMISLAKQNHQKTNLGYFCRDFYDYTSSERFDVIIVFDAYPHFQDQDLFASKAAALLKKGGRLYILHDASKEAINAHHQEGTKKELSRPLRSAKKEAFYFWKQFKKGRLEDDETHYFIELIRR